MMDFKFEGNLEYLEEQISELREELECDDYENAHVTINNILRVTMILDQTIEEVEV